MKRLNVLLLLILCFTSISALSQQKTGAIFEAAKPHRKHYNALYILNSSDDKKMHTILRNISNALNDPRLKGRLQVEVIAFADGVELYKKSNNYQTLLLSLKKQGVVFAQCSKTMEERKIKKDELYDFVNYVPSGNGEIILRQYEGWAVVHP